VTFAALSPGCYGSPTPLILQFPAPTGAYSIAVTELHLIGTARVGP